MFETLGERLTAALKKISGRGVLRAEDVDAGLREVRLALLEADVNFKVVKEFVERVRTRLQGIEVALGLTAPQQVIKAVNEELIELLGGNSEGLHYAPAPPTVIMLVGLQGSGKTTTAVKLALLTRRDGHKPLVAALDLRRPAAVEQLKTLAIREGIAFHSGQGDVETIARGALAEAGRLVCDVVILDTAGRLQIDDELMNELKRLKAAVPVTETLLVADSMTGQEAVNVGEVFGREVGLDGAILTKLDGDARGGAALSLRVATGQRIRFAGTGEKPQDLEIFFADRMASRILGMGDVLTLIERVERTVDILAQIRQVRGIGSLEGMLDMIPGGGKLKSQVAGVDTEREVKKMEAIILSMTKRERAHPEVIDGARKKRIARGSGVEPADVNRVLKAREAMQQLAKQFGAVGNRKGKAVGLPRLFGKGGAGW
jgi:signal recognition particle subunit SRP54